MDHVSTACVFFTDDSIMHGAHCTPCHCDYLYGKQAPWGCMWFSDWMSNVQKAYNAYKHELIIVYFEGKAKDEENGLGRSQQAEVRWLHENGFRIKHHWDTAEMVARLGDRKKYKQSSEFLLRKVSSFAQKASRRGTIHRKVSATLADSFIPQPSPKARTQLHQQAQNAQMRTQMRVQPRTSNDAGVGARTSNSTSTGNTS